MPELFWASKCGWEEREVEAAARKAASEQVGVEEPEKCMDTSSKRLSSPTLLCSTRWQITELLKKPT